MNISNFQQYVDRTIVGRGVDCFHSGCIIDFEMNRKNEYIFQIEGSYEYEVVVKLDEVGEIVFTTCDCPYTYGPICKHQVAALLQLCEDIENMTGVIEKEQDLNDILQNRTKEELIKVILEMAQKNEALEDTLILRFSSGTYESEMKVCKMVIDNIVRKFIVRKHYISYSQMEAFLNELGDVLMKARESEHLELGV
ncbi:MAG: SWIM zinc finger family protein, partial [Bacilli bacterium]